MKSARGIALDMPQRTPAALDFPVINLNAQAAR
jgi:hypothetical protein